MPIKALLFDFDETLLVNESITRESVRYAWQFIHSEIEPEKVIEIYMDIRDKFWHSSDDKVIPVIQKGMEFTRIYLWENTLTQLGIREHDIIPELVNRFSQKRLQTWELYPEVITILNQLKKEYKLVMITNGVAEAQWTKIRKVNIESYFDLILISGELGFSKPDPKFFYHAAELVNADKTQCIVIGDSIRNDIGGAKNAGIKSIWVNRIGKTIKPDIQADFEINSLNELPDILLKFKN